MRGAFSFDILLASLVISLLLSVVVPDWNEVINAERIAVCKYLGDLNRAILDLSSGIGGYLSTPSFSDSWIAVDLSKGEVNVWGESCR